MYRFLFIIFFASATTTIFSQDTISGDYKNLLIKAGKHIINKSVTVTGEFTVDPDAVIEFSDPGVIVCQGSVNIKGSNHDIQFIGKNKFEGVGIVIKGIDSNSVVIKGATFSGLQLPLFFDFGWKRKLVTISDNHFINNIGKVSVLQVLNLPFTFSSEEDFVDFKITNNLFSGNNASIYFEDLQSDHLKIEISNNSFVYNTIFGFKNYNISTNVLYGRVDKSSSVFPVKLNQNNFTGNYLIDNLSDTITHAANMGIYGTEKSLLISNNYWGSNTKDLIQKSLYDQALNYNAPKLEYEPFLSKPNDKAPVFISGLINGESNINFDDFTFIKENLKSIISKSNGKIDFSKLLLTYTYFTTDSFLTKIDTIVNSSFQVIDENTTKLSLNSSPNIYKKIGYYKLSGLVDQNNNYSPDVKIGYLNYLKDLRRRTLLAELIKEKKTEDSLKKPPPPPIDSIKNVFQKIEAPLKSRFEFGVSSGGALFRGTISNSNLFMNDMNILMAANVNYTIYSNLSASLTISSFKISNSDKNSSNNDQLARGITFSTSMLSISPSINFDFVDNRLYTKARRIRPSIGLGLDISTFAPTGIYKEVVYPLQPLGTGGQYTDSTKKPYSLMALGYFFNFKIKYQINRSNSVGIHFSFHKSLSDYLDDVGPDLYPTVNEIYNSKGISDKDAALYFSNPSSRNVLGQYRNSPNDSKDSYIHFGVFYSLKLFTK